MRGKENIPSSQSYVLFASIRQQSLSVKGMKIWGITSEVDVPAEDKTILNQRGTPGPESVGLDCVKSKGTTTEPKQK